MVSVFNKPEFIIGSAVFGVAAWRTLLGDGVEVVSARQPRLKPALSGEHNMGFDSADTSASTYTKKPVAFLQKDRGLSPQEQLTWLESLRSCPL